LLSEVLQQIVNNTDGAPLFVEELTKSVEESIGQQATGSGQREKATDPQSEAEACFLKALDIARQQQAKSWELRAVTSLARL
jgi:predicted ATPase